MREVLEEFVSDLANHVGPPHFTALLEGSTTLTTDLLSSEPEDWTENSLIWEVLKATGLHKDTGRPSDKRESPDFRLREDDLVIIGENKPINAVSEARNDIVRYIRNKSWPDYGIATDGIDWVLYRGELGGDFFEHREVRQRTLRNAILAIAYEDGYIQQSPLFETSIEDEIDDFLQVFRPESLIRLLKQDAPKEFREAHLRSVENFYDLYIELVFGESDHSEYPSYLLDDILAPNSASEQEKRIFAVNLVNRLFFVKFLEQTGVLEEHYLRGLVQDYDESRGTGTLYRSVIFPLFFDLLNTPLPDRADRGETSDRVPYLNGGLFQENVTDERLFDVSNDTLPYIIDDLIEASSLDFDLDPAVLGSVFEKTINYISEDQERQKKTGAYYTPHDVTKLVVGSTVDEKLREIILENANDYAQDESSDLGNLSLGEILFHIEEMNEPFTEDILLGCLDIIGELKILDPACGSGHFLTAAMEAIHQVQKSLLSGLGLLPEKKTSADKELFQARRELALNCIYGVDLDPVAVEIAKLRIWLKIVEDGWTDEFGELPNIDFNIVAGNSLVGFPVEDPSRTERIEIVKSDRISEFEQYRKSYRQGEISKRELQQFRKDLQDELGLDEEFLKQLPYYVEVPIPNDESYEINIGSLERIHPTVKSVHIRRTDGGELTEDDNEYLRERFFIISKKSARLDIKSFLLAYGENDAGFQKAKDTVREVLSDGYEMRVRRQPLQHDIEGARGGSFHWFAEFPEVDWGDNSMEFDIVLGNPPYGDVLTDPEENLTRWYQTSNISEVACQFTERQLQLLKDDGFFGNVVTLRTLYDSTAASTRDLLRKSLPSARIACFAYRPGSVFQTSGVLVAIITGKKQESEDQTLYTSEFIRFDTRNRAEMFSNIEYESTEGLTLGSRIGGTEDHSLPKIGNQTIKSILEKLKNSSHRLFRHVSSRQITTNFPVWRSRHQRYWINPYLENLFQNEGIPEPQDFSPFYFEYESHRDVGFLILQSSLFYMYWMVYGNERDINWSEIDAFPFPLDETIQLHIEDIKQLKSDLWAGMKACFSPSDRGMNDIPELKEYVDAADELIGPMFGLSIDEIEFVQNYHAKYGRGINSGNLTSDQLELEEIT